MNPRLDDFSQLVLYSLLNFEKCPVRKHRKNDSKQLMVLPLKKKQATYDSSPQLQTSPSLYSFLILGRKDSDLLYQKSHKIRCSQIVIRQIWESPE